MSRNVRPIKLPRVIVRAAAIADHKAPHYRGEAGTVIDERDGYRVVKWDGGWVSLWKSSELAPEPTLSKLEKTILYRLATGASTVRSGSDYTPSEKRALRRMERLGLITLERR